MAAAGDLEYFAELRCKLHVDCAPFDSQRNRSLTQLPIEPERVDTQHRKRGHMLGHLLDFAA